MPERKEIDYLSFGEIFDDRFFEIPDYQRGYSWEKKQVTDLIEDIERLMSSNIEHFTGTIVAIEKENGVFEIVDGQQRLTSLVILVQAICDIDKEKYKEVMGNYVQTQEVGNKKLKLIPNSESENFFTRYIVEGVKNEKVELFSHENIKEAKTTFDQWLNRDEVDIEKILRIIKNNLKFILFIPQKQENVSLMFEVINNRGKPLSELEKIKNYLIYITAIMKWHGIRDTVNRKWGVILRNLNNAGVKTIADENNFMRYCYIVFFSSSKFKSGSSYDEIKGSHFKYNEITDETADKVEKFVLFLEKASENYMYFHSQGIREDNSNIEEPVKRKIKLLRTQHVHASIMPLYLAIMCKKNNDEADKEMLLDILEKLNFRLYIQGTTKRSDSHHGRLFYLAHCYYNELNDEDWSSPHDILHDIKLIKTLKIFLKIYAPLENIQKHLQPSEESIGDFYHWNGLKYFLARYEDSLCIKKSRKTYDIEKIIKARKETKENTGDYVSSEHIWAVNNLQKFKHHYQKKRLGNFVLMGLYNNIRISNDSIEDKVKAMKECSGATFAQVEDLSKYLEKAKEMTDSKYTRKVEHYYVELSKAINDLREKDLVNFAIETWALDDGELKEYKDSEEYKNYLASLK